MKLGKAGLIVGAMVATLGLQPDAWATRAVGSVVTGEISASPSTTQIEIAHHVYRIKAGSQAAATARSLSLGELVDATLDRPPVNGEAEVVALAPHSD
jgi:hypothetical protein